METIRCGGCAALLFKASPRALAGRIEIKCRRCGRINHLRPIEPTPERRERRNGDDACASIKRPSGR